MFRGKNYQESAKLVDRAKLYDPEEALDLLKLQRQNLMKQLKFMLN